MLTHLRLLVPSHSPRRDDKRLARQIAAVFEHRLADTDVSGIRFFVRAGHIEIRGLVGSESDRLLLGSIVQHVPGVKHVENRTLAVRTRIHYLSRRLAS